MQLPDDLNLTEAEQRMWDTVTAGQPCIFGDDDPREIDSPDTWGPERTVRGHVLTELLALIGASRLPTIRQVHIQGIRVTGGIDLSHAGIGVAIQLDSCRVEDNLNFGFAQLRRLSIRRCILQSVNAEGAWIRGQMVITESVVNGKINLTDAEVSRSIVFTELLITGENQVAIDAYGINIGGSALLRDGFIAMGAVHMMSARIEGNLGCNSGKFCNPGGVALNVDGADIDGSVFLQHSFCAFGIVQLLSTRIGGSLSCSGGRFDNSGGIALAADGAEIGVGVFLNEIPGATPGFHAAGTVRLLGARIAGQLNCSGGRFHSPGGYALMADGAEIGAGVFLNKSVGGTARFHASGGVRLPGARIVGQLNCSGGQFYTPGGHAIAADGAEVRGDVRLDREFCATGEVRLLSMRISDDLSCSGGSFQNSDGNALNLQRVRVSVLGISSLGAMTAGSIDLIEAMVSLLADDPRALARQNITLHLDGFVYERIAPNSPQDVSTRLQWLDRQTPNYHPQPFDQLAAVYRRNGQEHEARDVLVEKLRRRRQTLNGLRSRLWDRFLDKSFLYGWQPWRPLVLGFVIFLAVFGLVTGAQVKGLVIGPSDATSTFYPFTMVVDVFLWNVDLGTESRWMIDTDGGGVYASIVEGSLWLLKLVGWGTITLALAARTRIVRRE